MFSPPKIKGSDIFLKLADFKNYHIKFSVDTLDIEKIGDTKRVWFITGENCFKQTLIIEFAITRGFCGQPQPSQDHFYFTVIDGRQQPSV